MDIEIVKNKDEFILHDLKDRYEAALLMQKQAEANERNADEDFMESAIKLKNLADQYVSVLCEMIKIAAQRIVDKTAD